MKDFFLLAKTLSHKLFLKVKGRIIALTCIVACSPIFAFGQACDCPPIASCGTCTGGLTSLTLRYTGIGPSTITASDQMGIVFSDDVNSGSTFTFNGSLPNQKFAGPNIELRIDGTLNTLIPSACASTLVGSIFGSFTVAAGQSLSGGTLCCDISSIETVAPLISNCSSTISVNLPSNACSMAVSWTIPSATDNCTMANFSGTHAPGNIFPFGSTEVIYTAVDIYGNTSTCSFMVVVDDPFNPTITGCPSGMSANANSSCEAVVSWTAPSASDNCSVTLSSSHNPGSTFPFGTTPVTYTATDQKGNTSTCTFNVTVTNSNDPVITGCPTQIIVDADENGEAIATWDEPQASTLCGAVTLVKSHEPGSSFAVGITSVIYTFTDDAGRSSICTFDVVVQESDIEFTISKAVTPNGDGINDIWLLENIENFENNTVIIIDRWGSKIFQATGYDNEKIFWDGTNQSGTVVPTGTYFYTIEVQFQGTVVKKKGYLEVIQ